MTGPLPPGFASMRLGILDLTNTTVAAGPDSLRTIFNMSSLIFLRLSNSGITGTIPESIGNLTNVIELYLLGNQLEGTIPSSIRNLRDLASLDLRLNRLNGSIPTSMSYILTPTVIYLSQNQFSGCFDQPTVISDPNKCLIDATLCGCTRAGCSVPVCPSVSPSCVGDKPVPTAECKNGVWVIPSSVTITGGQLVIRNPTLIGGDLVIVSSNSTLSLSPSGPKSDVSVAGCVSFNGTLQITLNSSLLASNGSTIDLLSYSGFCGGSTTTFSSVDIKIDCGKIDGAKPEYNSRSLSLVFTSFDPASCNSSTGVVDNPQLAIIIGCSVAGGVLLIVIVVLIVAFTVPAVGDKLMPWRSRRQHVGAREEL
jgi:hypothetical protein